MTDQFIQYICSIRRGDVTADLYHQARRCLIDYLAVTLSGAQTFSQKTFDYIQSIGYGSKTSTIIGLDFKVDMQTAALINGMCAHVIELDDGHRKGAVHVGGTVFSALLAVAEKEHLSCQDILYGAIIGYEVTVRLACTIQPGNKLRGYHATGTCGTVGATMGIAAALNFDDEQMKSALSAAVTSSAGVLEMQEDNADYKPLNMGRAAMDAVAAAYLGKARFIPPFDAIGGKRGFLKIMTDEPKVEYITDFSNQESLAISQVYMKTYAACRHAHPAIEAALYLRNKHNIVPDAISSVIVEAYKLAVAGHDHTDILGISSAKMSLPFSVALALCTGCADMNAYNAANVADSVILQITKKVTVVENEELSSWVPQKRASILHVHLTNGKELIYQVDYPKGEPENPLSDEELNEKFIALSTSTGRSNEVCNKILSLLYQTDFNVSNLMDMLTI